MQKEKGHLRKQLQRKIRYFMHITLFASKNLRVHSISETIDRIVVGRCSVARFGDGEMFIIEGKGIGFQSYDAELAKRLVQVMTEREDGFLVCIPDIFGRLDAYTEDAKSYWQKNLYLTRKIWYRHFPDDRTYYNSFVTRLYIDHKDKTMCGAWFQNIRRIWADRDVLLIEGKESRLGVRNDLFDGTRRMERILCPARNAFGHYDEILQEAMKANKDCLVLVSLGPTAKPLVHDLHQKGYQAVDIGHIDIEYEWYLRGAKTKVAIENKFVNEAEHQGAVADCQDQAYQDQVIAVIG